MVVQKSPGRRHYVAHRGSRYVADPDGLHKPALLDLAKVAGEDEVASSARTRLLIEAIGGFEKRPSSSQGRVPRR